MIYYALRKELSEFIEQHATTDESENLIFDTPENEKEAEKMFDQLMEIESRPLPKN